MPKIIIIEACVVNFRDDKGGQHQDAGNIIEVTKQDAIDLNRANRALYVNRADDPDKAGRNTASKEMLAAAAEMKNKKVSG